MVFTVLPYLRKQISLIRLLSILKISQLKHGFRFILVTPYKRHSFKTLFFRLIQKIKEILKILR
jgi:hypothetical protein